MDSFFGTNELDISKLKVSIILVSFSGSKVLVKVRGGLGVKVLVRKRGDISCFQG